MKLYKIKSILHNGRKGKRGEPREDGRYPLRIGRIVELDVDNLIEGIPLILTYVKDENGDDYRGYYLQCSIIKQIDICKNNDYGDHVCIETNNSIYEFEALEVFEK